MSNDWNTRYRPERFEDVLGQDKAASYLGGLVVGGKLRDNLLLFGDVGSGKTSLARIYARALNCRAPNASTGSPCLNCDRCTARPSNIVEYDVPLSGGDVVAIAGFLRSNANRGTVGYPQLIFFDEAQGLSDKAAQYLLKQLEDAPTSPFASAYVFATTAPERLNPALRSRLKPLHVAELPIKLAYHLLTSVAEREGIAVEPGCLDLVVRYAGRQPRNLISAMQVATDMRAGVLRLRDAKEAFGYDPIDNLEQYFRALAEGNMVQLVEIFDSWRLPPIDKIGWIEAYLTSFYLRSIMGLAVSVDPVVDTMVQARNETASAFLKRYGLKTNAQLGPIWRAMMRFWAEPLTGASSAVLRAALFHDKASRGDWAWAPPAPTAPLAVAPSKQIELVQTEHGQPTGYIEDRHVRDVVNGASFLVQHTGAYLNLLVEITPPTRDLGLELESVAEIDATVEELLVAIRAAVQPGTSTTTAVRVAENTDIGPVGYIAIAVPAVNHPDDIAVGPLNAAHGWLADRDNLRVLMPGAGQLRTGSRMHWSIIRQLLGGLADRDEQQHPLRARLKLPKSRNPGRLPVDPVRFWGLLSPEHNTARKGTPCELVSKFDEGKFDEIDTDWERDEFARQTLLRRSGGLN